MTVFNVALLFIVALLVKSLGSGNSSKHVGSDTTWQIVGGYFLMMLANAIVGRSMAINLLRDRQINFRFAMRNIGVTLPEYYAANYFFTFIYCLIQMIVFLFFIWVLTPLSPFIIDNKVQITFIFSTSIFLLAYASLCSAFSTLIRKYNNSADLVSLFTLLINFIPILILMTVAKDNYAGRNKLQGIFHGLYDMKRVYWLMPNMIYLQIMIISFNDSYFRMFAWHLNNSENADPWPFVHVLIWQFVFLIVLYIGLDQFVASDTGLNRYKALKSMIVRCFSRKREDNENMIREPINENEVEPEFAQNNSKPSTLLEIKGVTKAYDNGFTALKGINASIGSNKVTTILGHNGAGKSTLINILTCYSSPTNGCVTLNGEDIHKNGALTLGHIGYASAHDPLYDELTVFEFLQLIAMLKGVNDANKHVDFILRVNNLTAYRNRMIYHLSGGTKRRVSVAMAFIGEPKLIFLDEPSTGVDPENRRALWESINRLKDKDRIILLTTHHLEEAEFLSEDLIVLSKGQLIMRDTPERIKRDFGMGYQIVVRKLIYEDMETLKDILRPFDGRYEINLDNYALNQSVTIDLHKETNKELIAIVKQFERQHFEFIISANTLEQAYLCIDDSARLHAEEFENMKLKSSKIMNIDFRGTLIGKLCMLFLRKFLILTHNNLQILIILMAIFVPCSLSYFWISFNFNSSEKTRVYPGEIFILSLMIIVYYFFSFSFFGMLPLTERSTRIRYMLKMNGVGTLSYYFTMFVSDALISLVIVFTSFNLLSDLAYPYIMLYNHKVAYATTSTWLWSLSFIAQSYFVSYLFGGKNTAAKGMTLIMFSFNAAYIAFSEYFIPDEPGRNIQAAVYVLDTIFTAKANYDRFQLEVLEANDLSNENLYTSIFSTVIFLGLAMLFDFLQNRVHESKKQPMPECHKSVAIATEGIHDPKSVNDEISEAFDSNSTQPMQLQSIVKEFGKFRALDNISMVLKKSEILGLLGHNGAGKSTLFNIMSNYFGPTEGEVLYFGKTLSTKKKVMENVGLCAQDDILWYDLTVDQHLLLYRLLKGIDPVTVEHWKLLMDLDHFGSTEGIELSTGMKRKLCYIISMMSNPELKYLDEPTSGLDPVSRNVMKSLIQMQRNTTGGSTVFTTHTMEDAESICDRIAILVNGRLHCINSVSSLKKTIGGLNLTIIRHQSDDISKSQKEMNDIFKHFSENFPDSLDSDHKPRITDSNSRRVIFDLKDNGPVSDKLEILERLKDQQAIYDYEISHKSLENLFLDLAKNQKSGDKS